MNTTYRIARIREYYQGTLGVNNGPSIDDGEYDTIEAAQAAIDAEKQETYYLAHGEAGRPELIIVDDNTADYIESGRGGDMSNYDWPDDDTVECHNCGECNSCIAMMEEQDCNYVRNNKVTE
jgi:hypothetical protein